MEQWGINQGRKQKHLPCSLYSVKRKEMKDRERNEVRPEMVGADKNSQRRKEEKKNPGKMTWWLEDFLRMHKELNSNTQSSSKVRHGGVCL